MDWGEVWISDGNGFIEGSMRVGGWVVEGFMPEVGSASVVFCWRE